MKPFISNRSARLHLLRVPGIVLIQMNYTVKTETFEQDRIYFKDIIFHQLLVPYMGQPNICTITQQKTVAVWRLKKLK